MLPILRQVERINGPLARRIKRRPLRPQCLDNSAFNSACIRDIHRTTRAGICLFGIEGYAIRLDDGVVNDVHGAGGGREAVGGGLELRGGIDEGVEPGVFWEGC